MSKVTQGRGPLHGIMHGYVGRYFSRLKHDYAGEILAMGSSLSLDMSANCRLDSFVLRNTWFQLKNGGPI